MSAWGGGCLPEEGGSVGEGGCLPRGVYTFPVDRQTPVKT